jgi:hypothetical protein
MFSPQTPLNRKDSAANTKPSDGSGDVLSHRVRSEITRFAIIAVVVFLAAIFLPTGDWLELALQYQAYHIDDIVVAIFAVSFILMVFLFRGWRTLRQEARERILAVKQMEQRSRIDAQLSQMTSLLDACFALEEASNIVSHFARQLFPEYMGALYVFRSSRNILEATVLWGRRKAVIPCSHHSSAGPCVKGKCMQCKIHRTASSVHTSTMLVPIPAYQ